MTVKLKITTKWTLKMSKLGMVSSFHPHSMCKRVERVTAKTGRTSCTNWTISFEVSGFLTRTHLLHGHFFFLNLLQLQTFLCSVPTTQSDVINFQNFLTSFAIFQSFTDLFRELSDHEMKITTKWNMKMSKLGMVSSFHPHSMCKRLERVKVKTRRTSCTNWTISFGVSGFRTRTHLLH